MVHEIKDIELTLLNVNVENPRFEIVGNQRGAIFQLIDNQGLKLLKLATDILQYGLNPSELIIVVKDVKLEDHYVVLEGNRRVTALKLLNNPDLIPENHKSLLNSFRRLTTEFQEKAFTAVRCIVFQDESAANRWIKLKHTGENEGVGVVSWDAQQKARFEERMNGTSSLALQVIDYLKNQQLNSTVKKDLTSIPTSSLNRLLSDPDFRKTIGIDVINGKINTSYPPEELIKPLIKVVRDLIQKDFTVKDIYYKDDRLNYLETFRQSDLPDKNLALAGRWELTDFSVRSQQLSSVQAVSDEGLTKRSKSLKRNSVIPKSTVIHINQNRINKIYRELKDLDVKIFCNAAAITFRVFIELSIDNFIELKSLSITKEQPLRKKVQCVVDFFESNNLLNKHQLKAVRVGISNNNHILSIDTFNSYVHNKEYTPIESDLKTTWDNLEHFIVKLWDNS